MVIRRDIYRDSLAACDSANNSVFIVNVVMVFCLLVFYEIKPLNNLIVNAWELFRFKVLFTNEALFIILRLLKSPKYKARFFVFVK